MNLLLRALSLIALLFVGGTYAAPLPVFQFKTDGASLSLESLRGKVVYLDYWASWCGPCRESFPWMNELQNRYGNQGLVVVAVNVDQNIADAKKFLSQHPARFKIAYDSTGESAKQLDLKGMPSTFLVNRRGEIVATHVGFRTADKHELESKVRALLGQ